MQSIKTKFRPLGQFYSIPWRNTSCSQMPRYISSSSTRATSTSSFSPAAPTDKFLFHFCFFSAGKISSFPNFLLLLAFGVSFAYSSSRRRLDSSMTKTNTLAEWLQCLASHCTLESCGVSPKGKHHQRFSYLMLLCAKSSFRNSAMSFHKIQTLIHTSFQAKFKTSNAGVKPKSYYLSRARLS